MAIELITENVWSEISDYASKFDGPSFVAVAYFGINGSKLLPLKKDSMLLVDASNKAVKSGQTNPSELLKLYYEGVSVYSLENLHSKIYVLGKTMFIGSGNVSNNSANNLKEIFVKTDDEKALRDGIEYIKQYCHIELGEKQLKDLEKIYVPQKMTFQKPINVSKEESLNVPIFHIFKLKERDFSEDVLNEFKRGRKDAKKKITKKSRHIIDEIEWKGKLNAKVGDVALQITKDEDGDYVSPPGTIIHIHKTEINSKDRYYFYIEVPDVELIPIEEIKKKLGREFSQQIQRAGKKSDSFGLKMFNLFNKYYGTK